MPDKPAHPRFSYADYEQAIRVPEYDLLLEMSRGNAELFRGRGGVLDIASGQGFLLDALARIGVSACGVDTEPELVKDCRKRGLEVIQDDAIHFLATTERNFENVNCAHFIEHLSYEAVLELIEGVRRVMPADGLFVLRWPNPRSAVMQHLAFWRDPTHVRFYDGKLIQAILEFYGFHMVEVHYDTVSPRRYGGAAGPPPSGPRQLLKRAVLWTKRASIRSGSLSKRLSDVEERIQARRRQIHHTHLLFNLPYEAQIIARRGHDFGARNLSGHEHFRAGCHCLHRIVQHARPPARLLEVVGTLSKPGRTDPGSRRRRQCLHRRQCHDGA